ncbi:hypothetical protein M9H77_02554 [Catharanthus roseus]|uniref:Uncharacterized protein n=1 Tax=Catharanthus roseus TaxID=4058 RepID=A0ACC0C909_CATRO|nr:hypothetical protein M9H77_02554 [Catharanthus roseus]
MKEEQVKEKQDKIEKSEETKEDTSLMIFVLQKIKFRASRKVTTNLAQFHDFSTNIGHKLSKQWTAIDQATDLVGTLMSLASTTKTHDPRSMHTLCRPTSAPIIKCLDTSLSILHGM